MREHRCDVRPDEGHHPCRHRLHAGGAERSQPDVRPVMEREPVTTRQAPERRTATRERDAGFTLVEVLFAIVLGALISGVVVSALVTSLGAARSTTDQVGDSSDAAVVSSFLTRDVQ